MRVLRKRRAYQVITCCSVIIAWCLLLNTIHHHKYIKPPKRGWIVLYRILGNDLPPRHSSNQTLTNLLFILRNEPSFDDGSKVWVLNRIVDTDTEQAIIILLNQYGRSYIRIPFVLDEYRQIPYYIPPDYPADEYFKSSGFRGLPLIRKLPLIDILYDRKNLYVMNNNGARNYALRHGRRSTRAQWLMVFDGNCFLSRKSFAEIHQALLANGSRIQYFLVPMIRLTNNDQIHTLTTDTANEEPQVVFRRDSTVEYLPSIRYGCGPKEELLVHLGAMAKLWRPFKWEPPERKPLVTFGNGTNRLFQYAGFLFRLYSGYHPAYETSAALRACSRSYGIFLLLNALDRRIGHSNLPLITSGKLPHNCDLWSSEQVKHIILSIRLTQRRTLSLDRKESIG